MIHIYRYFCTLSSLSIIVWVYLIKQEYCLHKILTRFCPNQQLITCDLTENILSYILYFGIILLFAWLTTLVFPKLQHADLKVSNSEIRSAGSEMVFTYFGMFFYALSVPNLPTLILTLILLSFVIYRTTREFYNPLYICLGYRFYKIRTNQKDIMLISKEKFADKDTVCFDILRRLNTFTYIDIEKSER